MAVRSRSALVLPSAPARRPRPRRRRRRAILDVAMAPVEFVLVLLVRLLAATWHRGWPMVERRLPPRWRSVEQRLAGFFGRPDRPLRRTVAASSALHVLAAMLLVLHPMHREPRWVAPPMVVTLIDFAEPEAKPAVQQSKPKPVPQKPKPKPKPVETVAAAPRKDAPKVIERKPQPKPREERKVPPLPKPDATAARADSLKPQKSSSPNLKMAARVDEAAFVFDYYLQQVVDRISAAWTPPAGISGREEGPKAVVRFRIHRNGAVSTTTVEDASNLALFDRSALEAITAAQPLLPLPPAYGGDYLTVHLRFVYTDSRPTGLR